MIKPIIFFKKIYYTTIILLIIIFNHTFSQSLQDLPNKIIPEKQYSFRTLTIADGLSQNSVISIAQDSIGFLWMATQDGLNRYDGKSFKHYNKQFEDITRSTFSKLGKIYIDKQNRVWIITHSGKLELYNSKDDTFKLINFKHDISSIFQDSDLNFYIGTYNNGLFKIDYKLKDTLNVFDSQLNNRTVYDFLEVDDGLYITASGAVFKISNSNKIFKIPIQAESDINFSAIERSSDNTIWVGSYGSGLYFKSPKENEFKKYYNQNLRDDLNIEDLLFDSKKRLWIATYGDGVYLLKDNNIRNFKANKGNPYAIHYNDMLCLYEDNTGVVWFGSDGTGASYYDEHLVKFNILTNNQVPKNVNVDMVRCITTDNENNLWIGTSGKGLTYYNIKEDSFETLTLLNSKLTSNRIISLNYENEELWIGHQANGLNIMNSSGKIRDFSELKNFTIWRIVDYKPEQKWLCTEGQGIILYDKNKGIIKNYNQQNSGLTTNNIRALVKASDDIFWIGTDNDGVFKLDLTKDEIIKANNLNYKIKTLRYDQNILWIGTNGAGLVKYDILKNQIDIYNKSSGLPNDVVYGIMPDDSGNLWLSTNNGISKFNPIPKAPSFENFSIYDGLQGSEFNTGAYYEDRNGTIYFGGLEGINWFTPSQLSYNNVKPKTIITDFSVFSESHDMLPKTELKYNENTVTFTFSSLHFSQPERSYFKYMLENHDENWIAATGTNNFAHYTNLPPNVYTFKVISSNYDGVWNEIPDTFTFIIQRPWYLSTLAGIIYIFLVIIIGYLIYNYFHYKWQMKMQLKLEHAETKRLKKLDKFKTRLYTNLSHEFRTPLTLISGPVDHQLENPRLTEEDKEELLMIKRNSKRLLNLVDQLMDLSKLESGNYKLSAKSGNLNALLKQIITGFEYKLKEKNLNYQYDLQPIDDAYFDSDIIEKVITNLLSNATKYTPQNGDIFISSREYEGKIIISIVNSCKNLKKSDVSKLFKRYYQKDKNIDGVGVGLNLVKELCTLSHGNIVAHAISQNKIQFTVTLPIERNYYNSNEIVIAETPLEDTEESILHVEITKNNKSKESKGKPILLIVEDDHDVRTYVNSIFKKEYNIHLATNGKEGIKVAIKIIPDIIISDVMMPKTDGIKLSKTLKKDERTSHIPIILLTAKSGEHSEINGLKTGADDYITKPFSREKLKIKVENLIELRRNLQKHYSNTFELNDIISTSADEKFFNKLKKILDEHIANPEFNAKDLSEKMLMSRMQLHRKLTNLTGLSTTEFIRTERLKLAKNLLIQNNSTVAEIAYKVGFNSPSYFAKSFKSVYNCTPQEYHQHKV